MDAIIILKDLSEKRRAAMEEALRNLKVALHSDNYKLATEALNELVAAAVVHGLTDLWPAIEEEGITLTFEQKRFFLAKLTRSEDFPKLMRGAVRESVIDAKSARKETE